MDNITQILKSLGITGWSLDYIPTSEDEFLDAFSIIMYDENDNFIKVSRDPSDFGVTWNEIVSAHNLKQLRDERNKRLKECDWITLKSYSQGIPVPTEWAEYQQALRDITNTYSSLDEIGTPAEIDNGTDNWPRKPE